jgi:hypothetical protein
MTEKNYIPEDYDRIKVVRDLYAFLHDDFSPRANVVLYPRRIAGDFDRLAELMAEHFKLDKNEIFIKYSDVHRIEDFKKTLKEEHLIDCVDCILNDMEFFHHSGARPHFRILKTYHTDQTTHDFHVDGLLRDFDRIMTCYNNPVTQYIKNTDVLSVFGHKVKYKPDAKIYEFQVGDIWKSRVRNKPRGFLRDFLRKFSSEDRLRAFVHRAQRSEKPRIMMVADYKIV